MIAQLDDDDQGNQFVGAGLGFRKQVDGADSDDDIQTQEWVRRQKAEIKELQKALEGSKREFKQSQAEVEAIRTEDPILYRKKSAVLEQVKVKLEKKIEKMNQRIAKVKEIEAKLK